MPHYTQNQRSPTSDSNNSQVTQTAYNRFTLVHEDNDVPNIQHLGQNSDAEKDEVQVGYPVQNEKKKKLEEKKGLDVKG